MQTRLDLPSDLPPLRDRLRVVFGAFEPTPLERRMDPVSQLIRAVISSRTYDEVAWAAFVRLQRAYPDWLALGEADPDTVEQVIDPVTFAEQKARRLPVLVRTIVTRRGGLDLDFLADETAETGMAWLQGLGGVGVKCAAATLAFSRLDKPVLVVDAHVCRVARRLGLVGPGAEAAETYAALMEQAPADWGSADFQELHWLMKPHGQSICSHFEPACGLCALRDTCSRVGVAADQVSRVLAFKLRREDEARAS